MLIAHVSDAHVREATPDQSNGINPNASLVSAISELNALEPRPDIVLMTGDFTNSGTLGEYEELKSILEKLEIRFLMIPGNHDNRTIMRAVLSRFGALGGNGSFIQYVVDDDPVRLVGLDTSREGYHSGELCEQRIAWLDNCLSAASDKPTAIFMHHPPIETGIWWMDRTGLTQGAEALKDLMAKHQQVKAIFCGHIHRPIISALSGIPVFIAPSIGMATKLDLRQEATPKMIAEPPVLLLHKWTGNAFITHSHYVGRNDTQLDLLPLMPNWSTRLKLMQNNEPIPKNLGLDI